MHLSGMMERLPAAEQTLQLSRQQKKCAGATRWNTDCSMVDSLMAAMNRPIVEPPHEPAGSVTLADLYVGCEFYDDISGAPLNHAIATAARKKEIEFFKSRGDYTKIKREP